MFAHDFPQSAPDAITFRRRSNRAGGDEAGAKWSRLARFQHAEQNEPAMLDAAMLFYFFKLSRLREPAALWKLQ
jgi:hypothetical protein